MEAQDKEAGVLPKMEAGVLPKMEARGGKEVQTWAGFQGNCTRRVFAFLSAGADTKANTLGAAAYSRLEIFVSLRTAASAEAPGGPMLLQ